MPRVRVIGCGNPAAGDDAVGLIAVDVAERLLGDEPDVEVVRAGDPLRALDLMDGADAVVLVDAVHTSDGMRLPGELVRLERDLGRAHQAVSSHGIGLQDVVGMATLLERAPRIVFWGVEAGRARPGDDLTPAVAEALPTLAQDVAEEARGLAHAPGGGDRG